MRVLLIKLSSIGDVVQALPVSSALRRRYADARISWAVEDWIAPLLSRHPAIDRVIAFPRMAWNAAGPSWTAAFVRAVSALRAERYDLALDLQGLLKSAAVSLLSRAPLRIGRAWQREGAGLISRPIPSTAERRHVVDEYLQCAIFVGADQGPAEFGLVPDGAAVDAATRLLAAHGVRSDIPLVVINRFASRRWKDWASERWATVADALSESAMVIYVGGARQRGHHSNDARAENPRIVDLSGKTTLPELVALLARCSLHLAPDTGTLHLAAALGRPVLGLYGPTPPWRLGPYAQPGSVVHHPEACLPTCPRGCRGACLDAITATEVIARARTTLNERAQADAPCR